jgi:hypothetical protein
VLEIPCGDCATLPGINWIQLFAKIRTLID